MASSFAYMSIVTPAIGRPVLYRSTPFATAVLPNGTSSEPVSCSLIATLCECRGFFGCRLRELALCARQPPLVAWRDLHLPRFLDGFLVAAATGRKRPPVAKGRRVQLILDRVHDETAAVRPDLRGAAGRALVAKRLPGQRGGDQPQLDDAPVCETGGPVGRSDRHPCRC